MKLLHVILALCLQGCYLGNGSPSPIIYWKKDGKEITSIDIEICYEKVSKIVHDERYFYLKKKYDLDFIEFKKNDKEFKELLTYFGKAEVLSDQCYYELGYRFIPPIYWCLSQDSGGYNQEVCIRNLKYKY